MGNSTSLHELYKKGLEFQSQNKLTEATIVFKEALIINDTHKPTLIAYSDVLYLQKAYTESIETLQKVLENEPTNVIIHYKIAINYFENKNYEKCLTHLQKTRIFSTNIPKPTRFYYEYICCLIKLQQYSDAKNILNEWKEKEFKLIMNENMKILFYLKRVEIEIKHNQNNTIIIAQYRNEFIAYLNNLIQLINEENHKKYYLDNVKFFYTIFKELKLWKECDVYFKLHLKINSEFNEIVYSSYLDFLFINDRYAESHDIVNMLCDKYPQKSYYTKMKETINNCINNVIEEKHSDLDIIDNEQNINNCNDILLVDLNNILKNIKNTYNKEMLSKCDINNELDAIELKINDYKNVNKLICDHLKLCSDSIKMIRKPNPLNYKDWNVNQMLSWITNLENGRYKKYIQQIKNSFISDEIENGCELPDLTRSDLRDKPFNITSFKDRRDLVNHFQNLKQIDVRIQDNEGSIDKTQDIHH